MYLQNINRYIENKLVDTKEEGKGINLDKGLTDTVGDGEGRLLSPTALKGDFAVDASEATPI